MSLEEGTFHAVTYLETSLPQKPRLAPWVNLVDLGDELLQFRAPDFVFTLRSNFLINIFKTIQQLLDGSHTVDEISSACDSDIQPTTVTFLLKMLCANGLLQEGEISGHPPLTSNDLERYKGQLTFLSQFVVDPQNVLRAMFKAKVMVLGPKDLKELIIKSLVSIGISQVEDIDKYYPENNDQNEKFISALKKIDFLIACQESQAFSFFETINKACLEAGTRWMRVSIEGTSAILGPTVVPSQTACYSCYDRRLFSNISEPEHYSAYKNQVNQTLDSIDNGSFPPLWSLLGNYAAIELAKIVSGFAPPATIGRFYKIQGMVPSGVGHEVLRVPKCPACGSKSPGQDPWHSISPFSKEQN